MKEIDSTKKEQLTAEEFRKVSELSINQIVENYPNILIKAISASISISNILENLGLQTTNNRARKCIINFAEEHSIQLPKYTPASPKKLSKEDVMSRFVKSDKHYGSRILVWVKRYNLIEYKCAGDECQLISMNWGSREVPLELDHINGDNTDNRLDNLRFLCPICHRLTDTYGGKNKTFKNIKLTQCRDCGEFKKEGKYCNDCQNKRINNSSLPSIEVLIEEVKNSSITRVAKQYNISRETLGKVVKKPENYEMYPITRIIRGNYPALDELVSMIQIHGIKYAEQQVGVNRYSIDRYLSRRGIKLSLF